MEQELDPSLEKNISVPMLLKFTLPTIVAYVFMGIFGIVDGIFVSRIIGEYALSAVSLVIPFLTFVTAIGLMFGTGGNALVAKEIGEGSIARARSDFTLVSVAAFMVTVSLSILGVLFPDFLLNVLGVDADVYHLAREYFIPLVIFIPFTSAGIMFQTFLITEGKAHLGTIATVIGGSISIFLNWLLLHRLNMGLHGAALSTSLGYAVPTVFGLIYFATNKKRKGVLYFVKPKLKLHTLARSCLNGMSEMVTMMATAITSTFMNNILMDLDGPMAVAAAGIMMAGFGTVSSVFIGYAAGVSSLVSYNYGKLEKERLKKIFNYSLWIVSVLSLFTVALSWLFTDRFIGIYLEEPFLLLVGFIMLLPVYEMAFYGIRLISFGYIFMAVNSFASMFFTSFNNAKYSTIIALMRGIGFFMVTLAVLPMIMGIDGVWIAMPVADVLTLFFTVWFLFRMRKVYHYA